MKFYKRLSIDNENPRSSALAVELDGRIVTNTKNSLQIPAGAYFDRPNAPVEGMVRYSTDMQDIEAFIQGQWTTIKTNRQANITKQVFTNTNYANRTFGPLAYNVDPTKPENVFVYVENVYQLPGANYELVESTDLEPWTTSTTVVQVANPGDTVLYLDDVADFNPGLFITGDNMSGNIVSATDVTTNAIEISPGIADTVVPGTKITVIYNSGTYVHFSFDAVPVPEKPVTTLLGLDGYAPPFTPPI